MKKVTETAVAETAYGNKLDKPLTYTFSYDAFETIGEVHQAGETMSDKEIVKFRNNERKANERTKALTQALKDIGIEKPTLENSVLLQLQTLFKVYKAKGMSDEQAKTKALSALEISEWPE